MKFAQISKRIFLFLAVNALVVLTISLVLSLLGVPSYVGSGRYGALMVFCLVWGMAGAFISLFFNYLKEQVGTEQINQVLDRVPFLKHHVETGGPTAE